MAVARFGAGGEGWAGSGASHSWHLAVGACLYRVSRVFTVVEVGSLEAKRTDLWMASFQVIRGNVLFRFVPIRNCVSFTPGFYCCILVQYVDHLIKVLDLDETSCSRLRSNPFFTSPVV